MSVATENGTSKKQGIHNIFVGKEDGVVLVVVPNASYMPKRHVFFPGEISLTPPLKVARLIAAPGMYVCFIGQNYTAGRLAGIVQI